MNIRVEAEGISALEFLEESLLVAAVADVIANVIGIGQRKDDEVMPVPVAERARAGRLGFLVLGLAVDDRGGRFAGVFAHPFPDAHDVATSGVDDLAAAILDLLQNGKLRPERREDDDVVGLQLGDIGLLVRPGEVLDP